MKGLIKKYNISRTDGKELDPNDKYIVLRYTGEDDWAVMSRTALMGLCDDIAGFSPTHPLANFGRELKADLTKAFLESLEAYES